MARRKNGSAAEPDATGTPAEDEAAYLELLGQKVRSQRMRRGMTRKQLAQDSGVSERYLAQLESGRGNISVLLLRQVARAMGLPLADLAAEGPERPVEEQLLIGLIRRLEPEKVAEAHALLSRSLGLADADRRLDRVALIGLRGAGKTTLGRLLAERLGVPFVELTKEMEQAAGIPLPEMIALGGQPMLRRLESRTLKEVLAKHQHLVLATGGGLVAEPATYDFLLANCYTIWLTARPEEHMNRVLAQGDNRPMADNPEAMEDLQRILSEREALYAKADARFDTAEKPVPQCLEALLQLVPPSLAQPAAQAQAE